MPFNGPGTYEIIPYQAPTLSLNSAGGGKAPGEEVKAYSRSKPPGINTVWQVAIASGSGNEAEYLLINCRSNFPLQATAENTIVSCQQVDPRDKSVRWTIKKAFTNGYDVWTVDCVADRGQLNMRGSGQTAGTDVLSYQVENTDNTKFYFDPA